MVYFNVSQQKASRNLAARTIQKRWRNRSMGRIVTTAKIAQVARAVQSKDAETKGYLSARSQTLTSDTVYAHNLLYPIGQGTSSATMVGKQINLVNMRFRSTLLTGVVSPAPKTFRILIVKTKQYFTASSTSTPYTNIFRNSGGSVGTDLHVDLSKVSILMDKQVTINTSITGVAQTKHVNFNIPFNKKIKFDADNSGIPKDGNYFLIVTGTDYSGINTVGQYFYDWSVNFKDE